MLMTKINKHKASAKYEPFDTLLDAFTNGDEDIKLELAAPKPDGPHHHYIQCYFVPFRAPAFFEEIIITVKEEDLGIPTTSWSYRNTPWGWRRFAIFFCFEIEVFAHSIIMNSKILVRPYRCIIFLRAFDE